jgi:hypothetical protein
MQKENKVEGNTILPGEQNVSTQPSSKHWKGSVENTRKEVTRDEHHTNLESYTTGLELTAYRQGLLRHGDKN